MRPHRYWFYEYNKYDGGIIFLGDYRNNIIIGRGKFKLNLMAVRIRTLYGVLYIPTLVRNLIFLRNMDVVYIGTMFEKSTWKIVRGELVLMSRFWIETMNKIMRSIVIDGFNSSIVPRIVVENLVVSCENTMLCSQRLGHIGENDLRILHGNGMV